MIHGGNVWQGGDPSQWLDFSANLRPEGPPKWVKREMQLGLAQIQYYPEVNLEAARTGVAAFVGAPPECVLPTAGGLSAIDLICRSGTGRVCTLSPFTFGEYARRAEACGRETAADGETFRPGDDVFLCNPNNPTGEALSSQSVLLLAGRVQNQGARLIVDEAFGAYEPMLSVAREAAVTPGLAVVGSLTKILGVPGARLGYLIACPETVDRLEALQGPWALNSLAVAVARALPRHLEEIAMDAQLNRLRRQRLTLGLRELGARVTDSHANFVLADFNRPMSAAAKGLREEKILVRLCDSFGFPDSCWRLAVKTEAEQKRLLSALERWMR